jgi:hypothetical protein
MIRNLQNNKITKETRLEIADAILSKGLAYQGKVNQADFLNRLYDLKSMRSTDSRPDYDNAYKDIHQHADRNPGDWAEDWVFTDERLNLSYCPDEDYTKFLYLTLNPNLRENDGSAESLASIYNASLSKHGLGFYKENEINGAPIYAMGASSLFNATHVEKSVEIKKYLDSDYVHKKIDLMNKAVITETDVAIGTGKELLETICKSIMKQRSLAINKDWTLPQLVKNTTASMDFKPKGVENPDGAERSVKQILNGINTIIQGVTELRNAYGSGHGKSEDFKGLEPVYAKLFVGVVADAALFLLGINGKTELEE